jgi:hypothetical protein
MSKESKILQAGPWGAQSTISHYECFGWELVSMNGNQIIMARETQDSVYPELVKHQAAYEGKVAAYQALKKPVLVPPVEPKPISIKTCFILFLLFIFPFALYLAYKITKKKEYDEKLAALQAEHTAAMNAYNATKSRLVAEAEAVAAESRAIFFAPRD